MAAGDAISGTRARPRRFDPDCAGSFRAAGPTEDLVSWGFVVSRVVAAALLVLGFDLIMPLGERLDAICNLAGLASGVVFIGLSDGV